MTKMFTYLSNWKLKFTCAWAVMLTVGVGNVWGTTPTTEDLNFGTPAVNANFNNLSTTSANNTDTKNPVTNNSLSGYGPFTVSYLGKAANGTQSIAIAAGDNSPMTSNHFSMVTTTNGSSVSFAYTNATGKGAFSFKIAKSSKATIGLYNGAASGSFSHSNSAVWLQFDGGSNIKWSMGTNSGTPSGWQTVTSSLPSADILDITVIYNNTASAATYGSSISIGAKTAHVYVNGNAIMNGENPKALSLYGNAIANFRIFNNSASTVKVDDIVIYSSLPTAAVSCSNTVSLSKGSESHGTLTLGSTSITTCNETASTRQVTISVSPSTGYAAPTGASPLTFTKSSGTVTATYKSGPTGSSSPYTYVYEFDKDDSGAGTFGVTCSAKSYTVTLNDGDGSGGSGSKTVTYNANTNLTSAVTVPTRTGYDFAGYKTSSLTLLIDEDGNWLASKTGYTDASKNWIYADDITLNAQWTIKSYSVTWMVNGEEWSGKSGSSSANYNTAWSALTLPTAPTTSDGCGQKFVGWTTTENYSNATTAPTDLLNADNKSGKTAVKITDDVVFYAVFADYDED